MRGGWCGNSGEFLEGEPRSESVSGSYSRNPTTSQHCSPGQSEQATRPSDRAQCAHAVGPVWRLLQPMTDLRFVASRWRSRSFQASLREGTQVPHTCRRGARVGHQLRFKVTEDGRLTSQLRSPSPAGTIVRTNRRIARRVTLWDRVVLGRR